jgi:hypothetical protein
MVRRAISLALAFAIGSQCAAPARGQQAYIEVPFGAAGSSFYEQIGTSWGMRGNGWFFNFGGPPPAPPFGGFDPNAGAQFGFAGPNGFFNFTAGQGANTTFSGQAPSVTVMNGATGFFSDTIQRPFVTGIIPVVGTPVPPAIGPMTGGPSVLEERLSRLQAEGGIPAAPTDPPPAAPPLAEASTAERGDLSVAEIKARQAAEKSAREAAGHSEIAALLEKARGAQEAGKPGVARLYLQMAARRATGDQQRTIQDAIKRLEPTDK